MSIKVMSLVWDYFNNGGSEKLVMLAMADWCNDAGGSLHPSIASIAKKTCVSECQARRTVHNLINQGYLAVVGNSAGGDPGKSRQYQVNLSMLTPSTDASPTPSTMTTSMDATPSTNAHVPLAPMHVTPSMDASPTPSMDASLTTNILPRTTNRTTKDQNFVLPDWIDKDDWGLWMKTRKGKKMIPEQMQSQVKKLEKWKNDGLDYRGALFNAASNGYTGLFLPDARKQSIPKTENFDQRNYGEGITAL